MKRFFAAMLAACLLFLTGCAGKAAEPEAGKVLTGNAPKKPTEMTWGYVPEEVETPVWMDMLWGWDTVGDTIWLGAEDTEGRAAAASYDTLSGQWARFDLDAGDAHNPEPVALSVTADSLWVLLRESLTDADIMNGVGLENLGYYVLRLKPGEGSSSCARLPFTGDVVPESSDAILFSILALDQDRALVTGFSTGYVVDREANLLGQQELPANGELFRIRVNDRIYVRAEGGYAELDRASLQLGEMLPVRYRGNFSSNAGSVLYSAQKAVHRYDAATGEKTELFQWADVALSYEEMGDRLIFENSKGEFFYPTSEDLIKVTGQQVPVKQTLTMACFSNDSIDVEEGVRSSNLYTEELMDAIIRFNNTDPEYKVEIKPVHYESKAERDRLLIEIATSKDIDLIDTSILPENAIKDGLLVDMLPYIDADTEISREDFIEPLLNAMMKRGGLYEYTDKFTLLTMFTREDCFPGREAWTVDGIRTLMVQHAELDCLSRERLLETFILAATAEFIDWETMSCSFDSLAFQSWLSFLKERPEHIERYESPLLFHVSADFVSEAGNWARTMMETDYAVSGFPNASGTGSYFVKLRGIFDEDAPTMGSNTRLGILASGAHPDGAWRFVKTLMLGAKGERSIEGIPIFKERFEKALEAEMAKKHDVGPGVVVFGESDAQVLREQVYGTTKLVHHDEVLLQLIRSETAPYFAGQKTLEETVQQIQTRVGIYLAEQE